MEPVNFKRIFSHSRFIVILVVLLTMGLSRSLMAEDQQKLATDLLVDMISNLRDNLMIIAVIGSIFVAQTLLGTRKPCSDKHSFKTLNPLEIGIKELEVLHDKDSSMFNYGSKGTEPRFVIKKTNTVMDAFIAAVTSTNQSVDSRSKMFLSYATFSPYFEKRIVDKDIKSMAQLAEAHSSKLVPVSNVYTIKQSSKVVDKSKVMWDTHDHMDIFSEKHSSGKGGAKSEQLAPNKTGSALSVKRIKPEKQKEKKEHPLAKELFRFTFVNSFTDSKKLNSITIYVERITETFVCANEDTDKLYQSTLEDNLSLTGQ